MSCTPVTCTEGLIFGSTTFVLIANVALVFTNVLALSGYMNASSIGTINLAIIGSFALINLGHLCCTDNDKDRVIFMSTLVVLSILMGLSALGVYGIFNAKQVALSAIPLAALGGLFTLGVFGYTIYGCWKRI